MNRITRCLRTIADLRPVQIANRVWRHIYCPAPDLAPPPAFRKPLQQWKRFAPRPASIGSDCTLELFHERHRLSGPDDWNNPAWPRLWLYNLHYFDGLCAENPNEACGQLVERWLRDNPPGSGCGWEPYPLSRRIVNWIKYELGGNHLSELALHSLAVQVRYLRARLEYHLLGNHLLANAVALIFSGLFFEGKEPARWRRKGVRLFERELKEQILPDGGHIERSPMYHAIVLEDLLDIIQLHGVYGLDCPPSWAETAGRMLSWLRVMTHPDGGFALFNDCAFNGASAPAVLETYADGLGIPRAPEGNGNAWLEHTGYLRVEEGNLVLFFDAGSVGPRYQPGHAHADTFSVEMSIGRQRLLVDSGTSCYGISPERQRQRATPAHNTLSVDGCDSTEVWSSHRAGRKARVTSIKFSQPPGGQGLAVLAVQDGFSRLRGVRMHSRRLDVRDGRIVIEDTIDGSGPHELKLSFHFHPDIIVSKSRDVGYNLKNHEGLFLGTLQMDDSLRSDVEPATWHPEFGMTRNSVKLAGTCTVKLPARFTTVFELAEALK
ncbi:MAG TPA: alginate lyase family protein [Kiritimatiellia bacterium]|nr:alginate lyase family protein [Kiritimatiellia bacterium]